MKNHVLLIAVILLLISSCVIILVTYFGDRLPPTTSIEIYYSAHDVKHEYKVIGHLTCPNFLDQEEVKSKLSDYAKTVGADAVVIWGLINQKTRKQLS